MPPLAYTGDEFPVDLTVSSPRAAAGSVEITADGKPIGTSPVKLTAGDNRVRVHASLNAPGAFDLGITIRAPSLGEIRADQAVTLRRPRILYLSQDPPASGANLLETLDAAQFDVQQASEIPPGDFTDYQIVVFNNWNFESIPKARKDELERFVQQGGGLLVIGGEKNSYPDNKKTEDALDRTLPAKLEPPRSPEGTAVVLIIDKSSSMEGRKMDLARLSAIGVIDHLRPIDQVGVLVFDNSFQWAVPIRKAQDRTFIERLVSGIIADGGTQIPPAIEEAYKRILPLAATYKHIVLLTDGISEEGDSVELARQARDHNVTISTVGLGDDVNRAYLEQIASAAGGKSYFLDEPAGLQQILLRDVLEHTGSTAIEKVLIPKVAKQTEVLDGVGIESAPPLLGYVRFTAKPGADTILTVDGADRKDPLLVSWQYGLGRAAVFTSDAKSRWAKDWVTWKGFDAFWGNVFRDLLPHAQAGEATATLDSANNDLIVNYRLGKSVPEPREIPGIYAFGPGDFKRPVTVSKIAAGSYRGRVAIGEREGLFRVRPLAESRAFPEVGLYRPEQELDDYGSNELLLRQVAEFTGGHFNPSMQDVFDAGGRSIASMLRLWPGLLGLAIALNLVELILRKWRGIFRRRD